MKVVENMLQFLLKNVIIFWYVGSIKGPVCKI